jgi:hypothetical protein
MPEHIDKYSDPYILIPMLLMGVILFCVIYKIVGNIELFRDSVRTLVSLCVTLLALYGFDRTIVATITNHYVVMGMTILIGIAALISRKWTHKRDSEE